MKFLKIRAMEANRGSNDKIIIHGGFREDGKFMFVTTSLYDNCDRYESDAEYKREQISKSQDIWDECASGTTDIESATEARFNEYFDELIEENSGSEIQPFLNG